MSVNRILTAMVTPFTEDLEVDYSEAVSLASYLVENGSDGLVVAGTTGESPTLAAEEKLRLFRDIKKKCGDSVKVWGGTGSNDTRATVELSRAAEKTGIDGLLVVGPYYNKPSQEGLYQHFKAVAEASSLPIMLYNVPGRTGSNLLPATVSRLAEIDNIVAIKEASGNLDQVTELMNQVGDKLLIYSGDDSLTLPMLSVGASGVVSVASHLVGKSLQQMMQSFFAGDVKKAAQIHQQLFPLFKGMFISSNPIPVKTCLQMMGKNVGGFRLPLSAPSQEEMQFLKQLLKTYKLL